MSTKIWALTVLCGFAVQTYANDNYSNVDFAKLDASICRYQTAPKSADHSLAKLRTELAFLEYFDKHFGLGQSELSCGSQEECTALIDSLNADKKSYIAQYEAEMAELEAHEAAAIQLNAYLNSKNNTAVLASEVQAKLDEYVKSKSKSYDEEIAYYEYEYKLDAKYQSPDYQKYAAKMLEYKESFEASKAALADCSPVKMGAHPECLQGFSATWNDYFSPQKPDLTDIDDKIQALSFYIARVTSNKGDVDDRLRVSSQLKRLENQIVSKWKSLEIPCGLSFAERYAIYFYTSNGYSGLNRAMRKGSPDDLLPYRPFIATLSSALDKLTPYVGTTQRVGDISPEVLKTYQVGQTIDFKTFVSTGINYTFTGNTKFIIHSKTGRYVAPLSAHEGEEEVLFKPGILFRIVSREEPRCSGCEVVLELQEIEKPKTSHPQ
jgi:hypothetical protein